jgi:hypothetical protein
MAARVAQAAERDLLGDAARAYPAQVRTLRCVVAQLRGALISAAGRAEARPGARRGRPWSTPTAWAP